MKIRNVDPESEELVKRIFIAIFVGVIFFVIMFMLFNNNFGSGRKTKDIYQKYKNDESMIVLIVSNKCDNCDKVEKYLKKNDIEYDKLNTNVLDYEDFMSDLSLKTSAIKAPSIIIIENGEMTYNLLSIEDYSSDKLDAFFKMAGV